MIAILTYNMRYGRCKSHVDRNICAQEDAAENQRHKLTGNYGRPYEVLFVKDVR
jgi:hypothetical protein